MQLSNVRREANSETSESRNFEPSLGERTTSEDQDGTVGGQVLEVASTLSPLDTTESSFDILAQKKGMEDLEMHSPCQGGAEIDRHLGRSAFEAALGGDPFLTLDLASPDELRDLLDVDGGLPPPHPPVESSERGNDVQALKSPKLFPSKAPTYASDHTLVDVDCQESLLALSDMSQSFVSPTTKPPGSLFGLKEFDHISYDDAAAQEHTVLPTPSGSVDSLSVCSSIPMSSSLPSCQCMQKVLVLHEEVETKRTEDSMIAMDYRLSFQRSILSQCNGILRCKECRSISAVTMLLITICERLVRSFQIITRGCLYKLPYHQQQQQQGPDLGFREIFRDADNFGGGSDQKIYIGGYCVESPQEQSFLISRAVELQLRELRSLLNVLKDGAVYRGWGKHTSMLQPMDKKLQQIRQSLRQVPNDALDDTARG